MKRKSMVSDCDFYCLNCGNKGIPLSRSRGHMHKSGHRKKLFCIYCKQEVNHVECRTYADVLQFKEDFENGVYQDEAEESISYVRSCGGWQNHLYQTANC